LAQNLQYIYLNAATWVLFRDRNGRRSAGW